MNRRPGLKSVFLLSLAAIVAAPFVAVPAHAQSSNELAAIIAGLREDVRGLKERTLTLTAEIEQLKRENRALRDETASSPQYVTVAQFNSSLAELERALRAGDKDLALQLTKQMERLATQTQTALDAISKNVGGRPVTTAPVATFTPDPNTPKTGIEYTVQPGDTLATIAQRFNSSVLWIQSANLITDPRTLRAGEKIFVPQK